MTRAIAILLMAAGSIAGQILHEENFSEKTHFTTSKYVYPIEGAYHIFDKDGHWAYSDAQKFRDFAAEVRTEFIGGATNYGYGMIFRAQDTRNFYEFRISADGSYGMGVYTDKRWSRILPWKEHSAVRENGVNYIRVQCQGSLLRFYINGVLVDSVRHSRYAEGYVGFVAYDSVHAHFDDLQVYEAQTVLPIPENFPASSVNTDSDFVYRGGELFLDNFVDESQQWGQDETAFYERGWYTMYDDDSEHRSTRTGLHGDAEIDVRFRVPLWPKGGSAGMVFGMTDNDWILFAIQESGTFSVTRQLYGSNLTLHPATALSDFDPAAVQKLSVLIQPPSLILKINDEQVGVVSDAGHDFSVDDRFGLFAGQNTRVHFLAVRVLEGSSSWSLFARTVWTEPWLWLCVVPSLGLILFVARSIRKKRTALHKKRESEVIELIKNSQGSLRLGAVMGKYHIGKQEAQTMLDRIAETYGGTPVLESDGVVTYEFPDFMPSDQKIQSEIISLAALRHGRLTVTDTANFLKQDLVETEILLDSMVDGKRVRRVEEGGVVYYVFPEIAKKGK